MVATAAADPWPLTGRGALLADLHAASLDPGLGAVILTGPPGVGKTRIARELLALRAAQGATPIWVSCAAEPSGPLGSLATIVPHPGDGANAFGQVRDAVAGLGAGAPVVLALDDVHHLDPVSATVLLPLVESGVAALVVTLADGTEAPSGLASLWRSGRARAWSVPTLDELDIDTLLHRVLGGCVDGRVIAELVAISHGNVLVVRELVRGSLQAGALVEVDGVWRLAGRPVGTPMLSAMVRRRVEALDPEARAAVEQVAVAGVLELADLSGTCPPEAIEVAEAAGVLEVFDSRDVGGPRVRVADPLQRDVLLASLGRARRARLARTAYELLEQRPLGPGDLLRTAELRLDADGSAPLGVLLDGARAAKADRDLEAVERLCRAALAVSPDTEAATLLAEVLYEKGAFTEADALLEQAAATQADDPAPVATTRAAVLAYGLGRLADGVQVLAGTAAPSADSWTRGYLSNRLVIHTLWATGPEAARRVLDAAGDDLDQDALRSARTTVDALTGRTRRAAGSGPTAHLGITRLPDAAFLLALTESGALAEATEAAEEVYRRVAAERTPLAQVWIAHALGRVALARGRPATARRWFQEQFALAREVHQHLPLQLAVAGASVASVWLGDEAAAQRYDVLDDGLPLSRQGQLFPSEIALGRAWRAHARGDLTAAGALLVDAAEHALAIGAPGQAADAAHALVRLDRSDEVVALLVTCAERSDSPLVAAYADHARGLQRRDATALETAARRLADLGAMLVAAEAAAQAAALAEASGERRFAQTLRNLSNAWAAQCEGALTPGLAGQAGVTVSPLTRRERQIAVLVAQGRTSREVADTLFLSVRTVDNHLQRVFTKLGVGGRGEVGEALRRTGQWVGAA